MRHFSAKPAISLTAVFALVALVALVMVRSISTGDAATREGCMNQWLFNGVWRVQVTKVEPLMNGAQQTGWQVTEVWRNGTSQEIAPADSLLKDQKLELSNGDSVLASASTTGSMSIADLGSHGLPASGQFTHVQHFVESGPIDPANKAKAVEVLFDAATLAKYKSRAQFTTHQYNFHFKLDCVATAAAAQAQGGSSQIPAKEGCLNQWMSNGVWRVRATAVGPDNGDGGGPQIGWMVTEDWTSLVNSPLAPGDTNITDQQLVLASGTTISSSNSAGTQMNFMQLTARTFAPRSSFTYQQRFRMASLNPSDKPVKVIVTFDAKKEKLFTHRPQYKVNPPNYRISFACNK